MAFLEISRDGKMDQRVSLNGAQVVIGRIAPADLILDDNYVSSQHACISSLGSIYQLEDLGSINGTFLNGQELSGGQALRNNDLIEIGNFQLRFLTVGQSQQAAVVPPRNDTISNIEEMADLLNQPKERQPAAEGRRPAPPSNAPLNAQPEVAVVEAKQAPEMPYLELKNRVHRLTIERMNLKKLSAQSASEDQLREMAEERLEKVLVELADELPSDLDLAQFKKDMMNDILGLGPLEDLLANEGVTEIMVNAWNQIYFESEGKLKLSDCTFLDNAHVMAVIQRIVSPIGRAINESSPLVDARLKDGSRVNAIIPPLALSGPTLTIRKFSKRRLVADDLLNFGSLIPSMVEFLQIAVRERRNVVISGGTGSGKTTLLNILSGFIPNDERIVTVEDAAELKLAQDHVVSLEARPANMEGKGAVAIRDLVKNCLRMRPDRIVVGECRGGEALDMLQAMNTGHDGSLTTAHANAPRDVISRLETMVLMSGMELPVRAIREQISSAVDLIVQQSRMPDGSRKITHITEVTGIEGEVILTQDIFTYQQHGFDENGKVRGEFVSHGIVPKFIQELRERGIEVDLNLFSDAGGQ